MGKQEIYNILREGGLSRTGALAMMGNIGAESAFDPKAVENVSRSSWANYVHEVDTCSISKNDFVYSGYGFGLAQWTLPYRKNKLYEYAVVNVESIGDEWMQTHFIIRELTSEGEYQNLYNYLCTTGNLYEAVSRICTIYERPAVNNIDARYNIALQCDNEVHDGDGGEDHGDVPPEDSGSTDSCEITVRVLRRGDKGRDVFLLQNGLSDMGIDCGIPDGDFGPKTEAAVNQLKQNIGLDADGIADADVWQVIFQ